jgi:hypothetical protein
MAAVFSSKAAGESVKQRPLVGGKRMPSDLGALTKPDLSKEQLILQGSLDRPSWPLFRGLSLQSGQQKPAPLPAPLAGPDLSGGGGQNPSAGGVPEAGGRLTSPKEKTTIQDSFTRLLGLGRKGESQPVPAAQLVQQGDRDVLRSKAAIHASYLGGDLERGGLVSGRLEKEGRQRQRPEDRTVKPGKNRGETSKVKYWQIYCCCIKIFYPVVKEITFSLVE